MKVNANGEAVIKLDISGITVTMRSPTGRDAKAVQAASVTPDWDAIDATAMLISRISELTSDQVLDLPLADLKQLEEVLENHFRLKSN